MSSVIKTEELGNGLVKLVQRLSTRLTFLEQLEHIVLKRGEMANVVEVNVIGFNNYYSGMDSQRPVPTTLELEIIMQK